MAKLLSVALVVAVATSPAAGPRVAAVADAPPEIASAAVAARGGAAGTAYEGVVEALRQTVVAAQVPGAVVALHVRAGDRVQAGQVLLRIDARAAEQTAAAGAAQARAARAALDAAGREFERHEQLFAQGFISRAALEQAEARFRTAQGEASAQLASAGAARTQSELYVVKAPYDGVVAAVAVVLGDMALPGRPLLTLYDPAALRVSVAIPQRAAAQLAGRDDFQAEIPGASARWIRPVRARLLPTADAASHTLELRLDLPADTGSVPGMFARAWLAAGGAAGGSAETRLFVPSQALLRRSELSAVYVIGRDGRPLLRTVRPGRSDGDQVEILSGVAVGERVALDPQAAARTR